MPVQDGKPQLGTLRDAAVATPQGEAIAALPVRLLLAMLNGGADRRALLAPGQRAAEVGDLGRAFGGDQ